MLKFLKEVYSEEEKAEEIEPNLGKSKKKWSEHSNGSQSKASGSKRAETKNQTNKKTEQETNRKKMVSLLWMSTTGSTSL